MRVLIEYKGENSSNESDVLMETPRLVLQSFGCLLDDERLKIDDHGGESGDQMKVPIDVA